MASFMLHVYMYVCVGIYNKIFKNVKKKRCMAKQNAFYSHSAFTMKSHEDRRQEGWGRGRVWDSHG